MALSFSLCRGQRNNLNDHNSDVRFTPNSGHVRCNSVCPLSAKSGHTSTRVKKETASITSFIRRQPSVSFATPVDPMRRGRWRRVAVIDVGSGNTSGREDAYR